MSAWHQERHFRRLSTISDIAAIATSEWTLRDVGEMPIVDSCTAAEQHPIQSPRLSAHGSALLRRPMFLAVCFSAVRLVQRCRCRRQVPMAHQGRPTRCQRDA